jgi:hypothetical protein
MNMPIILDGKAMTDRPAAHSHLAERLAYEHHCPLLDLRSSFLLTHDYKSMICEDGIHPTRLGHELIDRELFAFCMA